MGSFPGRSPRPQICVRGWVRHHAHVNMSSTGQKDCNTIWVLSLEPMTLIHPLTNGVTHAVYAPVCLFNHSVLRRAGHCFSWKYFTHMVRLDRDTMWEKRGLPGHEQCCPASDLL